MAIGETIHLVNSDEVNKNTYKFYGVDCIVLTKDHKIILQKRGDNWTRFGGYLSSFGGQIEKDETPMQALIRELNEELGAEVKELDVVSLGAVTEEVTGYTELIHVYFWHDKDGTITGCYEGEVRYFDSVEEVLNSHPKIMDDTRWALNECLARGLLIKAS